MTLAWVMLLDMSFSVGFVDVVPSRATVHSRHHHADCVFPTRAITNNKVDFIGSLTKPYEYNEESLPARTALRQMMEDSSPHEVARLMLESDSLSDIAGGLWRIVYLEGHSYTPGFGQFFMNTTQIDVDVLGENQIICHFQCSSRNRHQVSIETDYGSAKNLLMLKVKNLKSKNLVEKKGLVDKIESIPSKIADSILIKNWRQIFAGVTVVELLYLDSDFAVFNLQLLGRVKAKRVVARKEPDFF